VLKKYEVKENEDEESDEAWPPKDPFYEELKKVVRKEFPNGGVDAKGTWRVKALLFFGTIINAILLYRMFTQCCFFSAVIVGGMFVVVNARMIHEGSHQSLSTSPLFNRIISLAYAYPVMCVSTWELQHVISHHQYTNYLPDELNKFQLTDIDACQYDGLCYLSKNLNIGTTAWTALMAIVTPFAFVYSPFVVGPFYAFCLLRYQAIYSGDVCKVKSHSKVSPDAALCIIIHIACVSYLTY
jgi:hypothetical protein